MRRFQVDDRFRLQGVELRVFRGVKPDGEDFVLRAYINGRWIALSMDWVFLMVDFLAENEDYTGRPYWRFNGSAYFSEHVALAIKEGHQAASEKLRRERGW